MRGPLGAILVTTRGSRIHRFQIHNERVADATARLAGAGLALVGLAAGYALTLPSTNSGVAARLFTYAFLGGLAVTAIVVGLHLAFAPSGHVPRLPSSLLFVGAGLLFLCGVSQIVLLLVVHRAPYLLRGLALGLGGGLGAFRLAVKRRRAERAVTDGA
jgi:hypothetical protein